MALKKTANAGSEPKTKKAVSVETTLGSIGSRASTLEGND
jgi:hypothetical protein